jgi:hypothetical protein
MTPSEWNACTEPEKMLAFLRDSGRASERKLRLFAVACCRWIWPLLTVERSKRAVQLAEEFAEGLVGKAALAPSRNELRAKDRADMRAFVFGTPRPQGDPGHAAAAWGAAWDASRECLRAIGWEAARHVSRAVEVAHEFSGLPHGGRSDQASLLRCIFGALPFRPVAWLTWNGGTVRPLAESIYERRASEEMGVLADAWEEAGCHDAEILAHCRGPGPHARGCWVIDVVLARQWNRAAPSW